MIVMAVLNDENYILRGNGRTDKNGRPVYLSWFPVRAGNGKNGELRLNIHTIAVPENWLGKKVCIQVKFINSDLSDMPKVHRTLGRKV